jgi:hypothetical protein
MRSALGETVGRNNRRALRRMGIRSRQHPLPNIRLVLQTEAAPSFPVGATPFGYCALLVKAPLPSGEGLG